MVLREGSMKGLGWIIVAAMTLIVSGCESVGRVPDSAAYLAYARRR